MIKFFFKYITPLASLLTGSQTSLDALNGAVNAGDLRRVQSLIQSGADPNVQVIDGNTPLHIAVLHRNLSMTKYLVQAGSDVNTQNNQGNTPLHLHALALHDHSFILDFDMVNYLIQSGADVNVQNAQGNTPLDIAVSSQNYWIALDMIQPGRLTVNAANDENISRLLRMAFQNEELTISQRLFAYANINTIFNTILNIVDSNQETLLHIAAKQGNFFITQYLVKLGANPNAENTELNTPLHVAAMKMYSQVGINNISEYLDIFELLIQSGADVNALNVHQDTPLYVAFHSIITDTNDLFIEQDSKTKLLIKLISWYIYQICRGDLHLNPENHAIIHRFLTNSYNRNSPEFLNPLFDWLYTHTLSCNSKTQLIESILEYLDGANEEKEKALRENIEYVFLQKEILEEFDSNFNAFKAKFPLALLEKLRSIARHEYAQKIKSNIFNQFFDETDIKQLLDSTTMEIEKDAHNMRILSALEYYLMCHCNSTKIQSPFVKKIKEKNQGSRNEKIVALATEYRSENGLTDRFFSNISRTHIENILSLIKNVKAHLDHVINEKGQNLNSSSSLKDQDILISKDKNEDS